MSTVAVVGLASTVVAFFLIVELAAAAVPLILVIALVPHGERRDLAILLAAADSRRRLRLWPALRAAAIARCRRRNAWPPAY